MRLLHHGTHWETSPIGVLPIDPRRMQGKRSGKLWKWCFKLGSHWFGKP